MADSEGSLWRDEKYARKRLLDFMATNGWFGIRYSMRDKAPQITAADIPQIREQLLLWLKAYKQSGRVKTNLMLEQFVCKFPITCSLYRKFLDTGGKWDDDGAWKLLDYLLCELDAEITDYTEDEIERFVVRANAELPLSTVRLFAELLQFKSDGGAELSGWRYSFETRDHPGLINGAYSLESFSIMAYCVFNEDVWTKRDMIKRAIESSIYSDLWLFVALHFVCALRKGDMARLPAPKLPYDAGDVHSRILGGDYTRSEAIALTNELIQRLELQPLLPTKTAAHSHIPDIKMSIPASLREPIGIIIAIVLGHHQEIRPGDGFVSPSDSMLHLRNFFGEEFAAALGYRRFSSRRGNKSYLQGIEAVGDVDNGPGKPKGYMLAAVARSHKGGFGKLAQTTDIYLKDARFAGYTPEFIAHEMFERGIFSFIPAILLEMYAGEEYKALPVRVQTTLITEIGLSAQQIEQIAESADYALIRSKEAIRFIFAGIDNIQENVFRVLQNIASGNAPSRNEEYLCLMTAASLGCPYSDRDSCLGCGYEIYTQSAMFALMKEYVRISDLRNTASETMKARYNRILKTAIYPAVEEMLSSAERLYGEREPETLLDIMKDGLNYANNSLRKTGRKSQSRITADRHGR